MKKYRVLQIGKKFQAQRWAETKHSLFFGLWREPSTWAWENISCGIFLPSFGYLRIHEKTCFDDLNEAIAFVDQLNAKPKIVYSI